MSSRAVIAALVVVLIPIAARAAEGDGAFVIAPKVGGYKSFHALDATIFGGLEVGYLPGVFGRRFGFGFEAGRYASSRVGTATGARLASGVDAQYRLLETETTLAFLLTVRFRRARVVPYISGGPTGYYHQSQVAAFGQVYVESGFDLGFQGALGLEVRAGQGGIFVEAHYRSARLEFISTGEVAFPGVSAVLGYRIQI